MALGCRHLFKPRPFSTTHALRPRLTRLFSTAQASRDFDVVVAGGGVMGASVAYHTALADPSLRVCVVERDTSYAHASAMLSAGGIRQQFSLPANIQLSLYGLNFLRRLGTDLCVAGQAPPDVQFKEQGYLFLASAAGEATLRRNQATQYAEGVTWTTLLEPAALAARFPWLNTDGIALGCVGEHSEGWFDPWALVSALRAKARQMGVTFVAGNVAAFDCDDAPPDEAARGARRRIRAVHVTGADGGVSVLGAGAVVNAAGAFAGALVRLCGGGVAPLPVAARKRCIFSVHCSAAEGAAPPTASTGLVVDPSGVYFRPEGPPGRYLCGVSPPAGHPDPDCASVADLDIVDHDLFEEVIWPALYERCEAFGQLKVQSSWAGFYEYNTLDQNALVGPHPHVPNLLLCNGFSGHGLQQSPGAGRAVAELLTTGAYQRASLAKAGGGRPHSSPPLAPPAAPRAPRLLCALQCARDPERAELWVWLPGGADAVLALLLAIQDDRSLVLWLRPHTGGRARV